MAEEITPYLPGDEEEILELFRGVFEEDRDKTFWLWENRENPQGVSITALLRENGIIRGHLSLQQSLLYIEGEEVPAAQRINTMVEEQYRGSGRFARLMNFLLQEAGNRGIRLVYFFPNSAALRATQKSLEVREVGEVPRYVKILDGIGAAGHLFKNPFKSFLAGLIFSFMALVKNRVKGDAGRTCPLEQFDSRFDALWKRVRESCGITTARHSSFLNWRYARSPRKYLFFERPGEKDESKGYVVLRVKDSICHIMDLLAEGNENRLDLLARAEEEAARRGCSALSCWCLDSGEVSEELRKLGFLRIKSSNNLALVNISCAEELLRKLSRRERWYIMLGDSDYL